MFTGIIQNQAEVVNLRASGGQIHFTFRFQKPEKRKIETGESIAVDGVCLTAVKSSKGQFEADAVRETLQATTLGLLKKGSIVNTERALRHGDAYGGHFVTGHVDGRGKILKIEKKGKNRLYTFQTPAALAPYMAVKGSVVVDGISLTVQQVQGNTFKVAVIPHTWKVTGFSRKKEGNDVNLEADLIMRYLERIRKAASGSRKIPKGPINIKKLKASGF